jgi:uncharacterized membrane protein YjjP (DUF1212 family)
LKDEVLVKKVKILLLTAKLLLQYGAETEVIDRFVIQMAKRLDCDENVEILILPYSVIITITYGNNIFTKMERADRQEVNFTVIDTVIGMCKHLDKKLPLDEVYHRLDRVVQNNKNHSVFTKAVMAGIGCGALSQIFGGELIIFLATFIASFSGFYLNVYLHKKMFNPFLVIIAVSFITSLIAGFLTIKIDNNHYAIASAILMLIPSIAFINSVEDMVKRHYTNGLARGIRGLMVSIAIAIGMLLALNILGIERFV